jgi:hypothetical protein
MSDKERDASSGDAQDAASADESARPSRLQQLPSAAEELARQEKPPVPVYGLTDAQTQRFHEAAVRERETRAEQAEENRKLRKQIANHVSIAVAAQVGVADAAFLIYGFWNGWQIPGDTMIAWLSATVVQVIGVGLVVTRSLFPSSVPDRPENGD